MKSEIKIIRKDIDRVDDAILALLKERSELVLRMRKAKNGSSIFRPSREIEILRRVTAQNKSDFPAATIQAIFTEIVTGGRNLEENLRVSYLGPAGSYSHEVGIKLLGSQSTFLPHARLSDVVRSVESGESAIAILPFENSTEGTVAETIRLLADTSLIINGEKSLAITHCLIGSSTDYKTIKKVTAHPQALGQCRRWLEEHLSHAQIVPALSNSAAVQVAKTNPSTAAIASLSAARLYQLPVIAKGIQDESNNKTRFITLGVTKAASTGNDKTTVICTTHNLPGALHTLLGIFRTYSVNLLSLASHPQADGSYAFYIDFEGHKDDILIKKLLHNLQLTAKSCKIMGSYPKELL